MNVPTTALGIVVYQVACTLFWPTPSEAPLLLYPRISLVTILALCVIGKVLGAVAILAGWKQVERFGARMPARVAGARDRVRTWLVRIGMNGTACITKYAAKPYRASRSRTQSRPRTKRAGTRAASRSICVHPVRITTAPSTLPATHSERIVTSDQLG